MKIAIDGPAGSGKSTVSALVAKELGFLHINTGAYYRWITYNALENNIAADDVEALTRLARSLSYEKFPVEKIRTPQVTSAVAAYSKLAAVRQIVVEKQRQLGNTRDIVMEGRDIGTSVFPEAEVKIFLTASPEERAKRKFLELQSRGEIVVLTDVYREVVARDREDEEREVSPLRKAAGAIELDTTKLTIPEVVAKIIEIVKA